MVILILLHVCFRIDQKEAKSTSDLVKILLKSYNGVDSEYKALFNKIACSYSMDQIFKKLHYDLDYANYVLETIINDKFMYF